jgi:hypothetical protein
MSPSMRGETQCRSRPAHRCALRTSAGAASEAEPDRPGLREGGHGGDALVVDVENRDA